MRGRVRASAAWGSMRSLLELQQDHGDVVLAAPLVGLVHERRRGAGDVAPRLPEDARDVLVPDHGGEPVRAEEEDVAGAHPPRLDVDEEVRAAAEGAGHHGAEGGAAGLLGRGTASRGWPATPRWVAR